MRAFWRRAQRTVGVLVLFGLLAACQPRSTPSDSVFSAVDSRDATRIGQYLAEGGDVNRLDGDGDSLLFVAAGVTDGIEVLELLLIGGADTELASREGRTPLHVAVSWCNVPSVAALIAGGAHADAVSSSGKSIRDAVCGQPADRRQEVLEIISSAGG